MAKSPFTVERTPDGFRFSFELTAERTRRHQKRASFDRFELLSDEGPALGGDDSAPPPLAYFAAALAFWLLTQLARVSEARQIPLDTARMTVRAAFSMRGSIVAGTAAHRLERVETRLSLESAAPREAVAALVAQAERMCFVLDAVRRPHAIGRAVTLNGASLDIAP